MRFNDPSKAKVLRPHTLPRDYDGKTIGLQASCLAIGKIGLMFYGPSGVGKSTLIWRLLHARNGLFATTPAILVGDDRVVIRCCHYGVKITPPAALSGLLALRHRGVITVPWQSMVSLNGVIALAAKTDAPLLNADPKTSTPYHCLEPLKIGPYLINHYRLNHHDQKSVESVGYLAALLLHDDIQKVERL